MLTVSFFVVMYYVRLTFNLRPNLKVKECHEGQNLANAIMEVFGKIIRLLFQTRLKESLCTFPSTAQGYEVLYSI